MAVQGPIPVEFASVFPRGVFAAGAFEPVRDFEASKAGRFVQSKDKQSGLPVWVVDVIDADPAAFVPVEFTGLTVTPYVSQSGRLAYSLRAAGVRGLRGGRGAAGQENAA
jgi:hypothetical protein